MSDAEAPAEYSWRVHWSRVPLVAVALQLRAIWRG
jgi:hypothetical protein